MAENILTSAVETMARGLSVQEDENELYHQKQSKGLNLVGFYSPYTNTGQTTILLNTAYRLTRMGYRVCVVDLDLLRPDVFRYLAAEQGKEPRSIHEKIIRPFLHVNEIVNPSRYKGLSYVSASFSEHPASYCPADDSENVKKNQMDLFCNLFRGLAEQYDFVLLDIGDNITEICVTSAFLSVDTLFTIVDGTMRSLESVLKTEKVFDAVGIEGIFGNLIQSRIRQVYWTQGDLQYIAPDWNLIMNLPYSDCAAAMGMNLELFAEKGNHKEEQFQLLQKRIGILAQRIVELSSGKRKRKVSRYSIPEPEKNYPNYICFPADTVPAPAAQEEPEADEPIVLETFELSRRKPAAYLKHVPKIRIEQGKVVVDQYETGGENGCR